VIECGNLNWYGTGAKPSNSDAIGPKPSLPHAPLMGTNTHSFMYTHAHTFNGTYTHIHTCTRIYMCTHTSKHYWARLNSKSVGTCMQIEIVNHQHGTSRLMHNSCNTGISFVSRDTSSIDETAPVVGDAPAPNKQGTFVSYCC
jgi:hypothetical protein